MTESEVGKHILMRLTPKFGERESLAMFRILREDFRNEKGDFWNQNWTVRVLNNMLEPLLNDYPIQYLVGKCYFYKNFFDVNESVLIPRPETETLVHKSIESIRNNQYTSVLDIGTGSGCIVLSICSELGELDCYGVDVSDRALEVAKKNGEQVGCNVSFSRLNILDEDRWHMLPQVNLIVSNPPYITKEEIGKMSTSTIKFEPHLALFTNDNDGLEFYKCLARYFEVSSASTLIMELNEFSSNRVEHLFNDIDGVEIAIHQDLSDKDRVLEVNKVN